jgi:hypothetical protein
MTGARIVHDTLEAEGWEVEIADAQKVKGLAPLACKTDKIDSQVLAVLSHRDLVPAIWLPDPRVRQERELARFRLHLVKHKSALKNRVHFDPDQLRKALPGHRPLRSRGPRAACTTPSPGALARQHHGECEGSSRVCFCPAWSSDLEAWTALQAPVKLGTVLSVFRSERVGNGGEAPTFAHFRSSGLLASVRLLRAAIRLAGVLVTGVVSRRPVGPLGDEDRRPLPGDELLPDAKIRWTHGITMRAWPTEIWFWLVQMGCRRAGWYSYDGLDNGGVPSADRIVPELQRVEVGDLSRGRRMPLTVSLSGPSSWSVRSSLAGMLFRSSGRSFSSTSTRRRPAS